MKVAALACFAVFAALLVGGVVSASDDTAPGYFVNTDAEQSRVDWPRRRA